MEEEHRLGRAWTASRAFRAWKKELAAAMVCGGTAVVALLLVFDSSSARQEALVVAASAMGGLVLLPLLAFGWEFLWVPWKEMKHRIKQLETASGTDRKAEAEKKGLAVARKVYRTTRDELAGVLRRFEDESSETKEDGMSHLSWDIGRQPLDIEAWRAYRDAFTSLPERNLYEKVRDSYELIERLNRRAATVGEEWGLGGFVSGRDGLDDLPSILRAAVDALEQCLAQAERVEH